ncbi:retrovirus-related pol polyprotein from transposon TNT 1-94 [Tanacetum coccineum]
MFMSQDVLITVMNSMSLNNDSVNVNMQKCELCEKCMNLDAELSKSKQAYNDLLKNHSQLEKHCISLEVSMQLKQEVFQNDESCVNQNAVEIQEYFEINDLKARLQDKDTTISKLKDTIKSLKKNTKEKNVHHDKCDLEPINEELENSVAKLLSENEQLWNEINHVKQVFKDQFDSIKQTRVRHKEQCDSLINKLNLKSVENEDLKAQIQDKLDLVPLPPRLLQNREAHIDYIKHTQENANILREIVKLAKAKQLLDSELDFAFAVTPINNVKKVGFAEPITSSSKTQQVESSKTSYSNTPVLSSTGVKCSTSNCGSKPPGNKKNDRISQKPSRNKKNNVEAQPRKVNKLNRVAKPVGDVDVKHSLSNANSEILCASCNKSMFDVVHDKCLLDFVHKENSRRTFTLVGNSCSLTRFTTTNVVPSKQTTSHSDEIQKPKIKVYCRKPKNVKTIGSSKKAKIVESKHANHSEPNQTWGSNAIDIPSSSSLVMTGCPDCTLVSGLRMFKTHDRESLSAHELWFGHNLFSIGQFCDTDLEVAFWKNTCFIRNLEGVDLLLGSRDINLYTISLDDMLRSSPICLLSKALKTKSWLWHHRLSHLNFGTLNKLAKDGLARGIPRLKFQKDHLCSACALGKSKKSSHQPKAEDTNQEKLYLLHMDLCGPMRVASINRKSCLKATVRNVRTDNGTEFVNQTLREWYENVGITHQTSVALTPQQNSVVERQNRTLVEAARTMLIFSRAPLFLWSETINTACYTQNRSLIRHRYNKTPYELMQDKKPDLSFFHVFGSLCYPTNDHDDLGKFDAKADIRIFVGYAPAKKVFRIYNRRSRIIIEIIHVTFDELIAMASEQISSGPGLQYMTPATSSTGPVSNPVSQQPFQEVAALRAEVLANSLVSTISIDQDAPSTSIPTSQEQEHSPIISQGFEESP